MPVPSVKYPLSFLLSILLVISLLLTVGRPSAAGLTLGWICLVFGVAATSYTAAKTYRTAYRQGQISFFTSIRNPCLEVAGILLAMALAGLIGRGLIQTISRHLENDLLKTIAGICIGLAVGIVMGVLIRNGTRRLLKAFPGPSARNIDTQAKE